MGFNLYFAGGHAISTDEYLKERGANRLFNQLYERNGIGKRWIEHKQNNPETTSKLFVDSSAYSAHTKGAEVDIDAYIEYVNSNVGMFDCIAELDKIPGVFRQPKTREQLLEAPQISWDNYLYMRERMIEKDKLLPIFHMGEDFKWLELMLETTFEGGKHIPYIGISPANDSTTKHKDKWTERVFDVIRNSSNPNVKTHAFGMTVTSQLERHPFYSADSTSVLLTGAMGNIMTSKGLVDLSQKNGGLDAFRRLPKPVQVEVESIIEETGAHFTVEQLVEDYKLRALFNVQYMLDWAANYQFKGIKSRQRRLF
nr:MAG TPA: hypothetical protein [Caudoviricetes sp.]